MKPCMVDIYLQDHRRVQPATARHVVFDKTSDNNVNHIAVPLSAHAELNKQGGTLVSDYKFAQIFRPDKRSCTPIVDEISEDAV
jgi:hypothetical protein